MERDEAKARPTKRVLVRWSDDLDKQVLLGIRKTSPPSASAAVPVYSAVLALPPVLTKSGMTEYACSEEGVRIPWKKVAELMGPDFSEGAIIQHLAKLRHKMKDAHMPVPPQLKRGTANQIPSKLYATGNKRKNAEPSTPGNTMTSATAKKSPKKAKSTLKKMKYEEELEDDDSDGEYGAPAKKPRTRLVASKNKPKTSKVGFFKDEISSQSPARSQTPAIKTESVQADEGVKSTIESPLSSVQTRGVQRDYKQYDEDDNEESDEYDEILEENDSQDYFAEETKDDKDSEDLFKDDGEVSPRTMVKPSATSVLGSATSASMVPQFGSSYNMLPPAPYFSQPHVNQAYRQRPFDRAFMPPGSTNSSFSTSRNNSTGAFVPNMAGMQDTLLAGGGYGQMGNMMMGLGDQYNQWPGMTDNRGSNFDPSFMMGSGDLGSEFVGNDIWGDLGIDFGS